VRGYEEAKNGLPSEGELRYLQMSLERESNKVQLVLVWNANTYKDAEQTLPRLVKRFRSRADLWHSVSVNFQTSESNAIFNFKSPKAWKLLWGPPTLREKIGDAYFFFRPQIFRQANLEAFGAGILPNVVKNVPPGSKVAELYSGIGVLGLNVASRAQEVLCSDSNEYVEEVFDRCADSLLEGDQDKVFYENLPAEEAVEEGQCEEAEVLIVDPPRRGLDQGVLKLLLNTHETATAPALTRLIYVSCGFDALEKDSRALIASSEKFSGTAMLYEDPITCRTTLSPPPTAFSFSSF
jgi:23S rRNA (uracil1939-C5)-methyltransferase